VAQTRETIRDGNSSRSASRTLNGRTANAAIEQSEDRLRAFPRQSLLAGFGKRFFQLLALYAPGEATLRVFLHRVRGVRLGRGVHLGLGVLIETSFPQWVQIGNDVTISMRTTIIAHLQGLPPRKDKQEGFISVRIEDGANIGPGVIILPNVTIGRGSVVTAGSVVTRSVPPLTMVQGNPAQPIAKCGIPLLRETNLKEFVRCLRPLESPGVGH
jgi:acetyltransferase-like isoleucine patch superfamily enzyme